MSHKNNEKNIFYQVIGPKDGPTVLFSHGIGMDHTTFQEQVPSLLERYRVVLWDMPGHGRSAKVSWGGHFATTAVHSLLDIVDEIGAEKVILVGQSLGSQISQLVASKSPHRVAASVHLGGISLYPGFSKSLKVLVSPLLWMCHLIPPKLLYKSFATHRAVLPKTRASLEASIAQLGKRDVLSLTYEMANDLIQGIPGPLDHPLLIIYGAKEVGFVRSKAKKWHLEMPGSKLFVVPDAGHIANQDNPEVFNTALLEFLDDLGLE